MEIEELCDTTELAIFSSRLFFLHLKGGHFCNHLYTEHMVHETVVY